MPVIPPPRWGAKEVRISFQDRAFLVQAKLRHGNKSFGRLTNKQKEHLPIHADYSAFVLYGYEDEDKTIMSHFRWQACAGMKLEDMKQGLKSGTFPNPLDSSGMIRLLYDKRLGTDNQSIITNLIATEERPRFEIRLHWPNRRGPDGPTVKLKNSVSEYQQQRLHH